MCIIGSEIVSTIVLSTSVSSPIKIKFASLSNLRLISRTMRFIFWNVPETGTMRRDMATSCRLSVSDLNWRAALVKLSNFKPRRSGDAVTCASVITISLTTAIKASSLPRPTEIKLSLTCACFACWAALAAFPGAAFAAFSGAADV